MRRSLLSALLALLSAPLAAARGGMPAPLTERGEIIEGIYYPIFIAATVAFLLVMFLLIYAMVRFRAKGGVGRETFELERDNMKLEMTWIAIPLVVVLWVGVISYGGLVELDEGVPEDEAWMELDVTGFQWTWLADYGSDVSMFSDPDPTSGDVSDSKVFVVPADVPIRFNVTSGDIIHALHLMDENWGTVGLVDANPYGPHKYTTFTATLPEGEYKVQCREFCSNPGHGYMRARVQAVPMEDFESWMGDRGLEAGAGLPQPVSLTWDGGDFARQFDEESGDEVTPTFVTGDGARAIITFANDGDDDVTVRGPEEFLVAAYSYADGPSVALGGQDEVTVPAGESRRFAMEIDATGDFAFQAGGEALNFSVVEAEAVQIDLGDLFITPERVELEAGQTYLFQINNVGVQSHNYFIGTKPNADSQSIEWESLTIGGGESTSFIVTPTQSMTYDAWCNVPGHWPDMKGIVVVQ